jgi:diadenosine tetraphosphate (Ap4A) HIT family hydrolase
MQPIAMAEPNSAMEPRGNEARLDIRDLVGARSEFFSVSGCLLCDEFHHTAPLSVKLGLCSVPRANLLLESENFVLLPDISPLVPGHSLLVPREHYPSFAQIPGSRIQELRNFKDECVAFISEHHAEPLLFEHGSGPLEPRSGACIHHAHIHLLPLVAPVQQWMREFGEVREIGHALQYELTERLRLGDYLAYQDQSGR